MIGKPSCCAGHFCDRCATCMSGVCCASGRTAAPDIDPATADDAAARERLRQAIAGELGSAVGLAALIRAEARSPVPAIVPREPLALPPAPRVESVIREWEEVQDVLPAD
jgi:hypothetical protein